MSSVAVWDGFLEWFSEKYPDVVPSELSGNRMKTIEKEYLEEATKEVEVNEYGEIVSKRTNKKGVRLKHHTFYGMDEKEALRKARDELMSKSIPIPYYWPEEMDYVALSSYIREEEEGYSLLKIEFRVPKYFKFSSELDVLELLGEMRLKADLFKKVGLATRRLEGGSR